MTQIIVDIIRTDGSTDTFHASDVETVNDVALVDGIVQTNVEDIRVRT